MSFPSSRHYGHVTEIPVIDRTAPSSKKRPRPLMGSAAIDHSLTLVVQCYWLWT